MDNHTLLAAKKEEYILNRESTDGWGTEDKMQAEYYQWAITLFPQYKFFIFHVPNGGSRNKIEAMKMKAMGLRKGVADLILINPVSMIAYGVELKVKGGVQSGDQKECQDAWGNNYFLIEEDFLKFKRVVLSQFSPTPQ